MGKIACPSKLPQHQHTLYALDVGTLKYFLICDVALPVYVVYTHDGMKASVMESLKQFASCTEPRPLSCRGRW